MDRSLLLAVPLLLAAATAFAHGGATGIVKERMDQMSAISKAMKAIGAMLKGAEPFDSARVGVLASEIGQMGGDRLTGKFPANSLHAPTEARPEIWTDWEDFQSKAFEMKTAAEALAKSAGHPRSDSDPRSPDVLFRALGTTCKTCHESFRIKK